MKDNVSQKVIKIRATVPPEATVAKLKDYIDAGFNTIYMTEDYNSGLGKEEYLNHLKLCQEMGLEIIIYSYDYFNIPGRYEYSGTDNCYLDLINFDLKEFPKIKGFFAWDEPNFKQYDELYKKLGTRYNEKYKNEYSWEVNLLPSYAAPGQQLGIVGDANETAYEKYIKGYFEKVHSKIEGDNIKVSLDHYPFRRLNGKNLISSTWLYDLALVSREAKKYVGDFGCCIQCYDDGVMRGSQSHADIGIQVYSSMVFGVKFFEMYHYISIPGSCGIAEYDGKLNEGYYHVQKVLKDIHSFEHIYLDFDWQGFTTVNGQNKEIVNECFKPLEKYELKNLPGVESAVASEDALIGHFVNKKGNNAYMIANFADPVDGETNVVELNLHNQTKVIIYMNGQELYKNVIDGKLILKLEKGMGAFVVLCDNKKIKNKRLNLTRRKNGRRETNKK